MQYDAKTPSQYIDNLDDDWRLEKIQQLRTLIKLLAPDIVEGINYKMLSYGDDERLAFYLNAQKNYVSFYVGDIDKIDPSGKLLHGLDTGKGCIRFKKSVQMAETRIKEFIAKAILLWCQGHDLGC